MTYTFTVFTPTYNRAHTLSRVYDSLAAQTFRDFEWLVVDDGSTDGTEALVTAWTQTAAFPIHYIKQSNQGKHIAHNVAVRAARGALFLTLDSDDACVATALERLDWHWNAIPDAERGGFSAITVLVQDQHGQLVGDRFPRDIIDGNLAEMVYRYNVRGEKWGFQRTDVLRQYLFTEIRGRGLIPEGVVWQKIGLQYRMRFVNEVLRIYFVEGPSLSRGNRPENDAFGRRMYYLQSLNDHIKYLPVAPRQLFLEAVQFARASLLLGIPLREQTRGLLPRQARALWALAVPAALILWTRDRLAMRPVSATNRNPFAAVPKHTPSYIFTVLTPTFNRAHTLPAVYESLCAQTLGDFEWLIVDDGSTDDTATLVRRWMAEGRITIRYYWQENGGKHVAFNHGIRVARGELLLTLDSDDTVLHDALARLKAHWLAIPHRERFSGVTGLSVDPKGRVIGSTLDQPVLDASPLDLMAQNNYEGDKWGFQRTDLLRVCPYPEIPGEPFIPEGFVWNRIADQFLIRFVNEPLRVVEYRTDGLSAGLLSLRVRSATGVMLYYSDLAAMARSRMNRALAWVNLARFACHAGKSAWAALGAANAGMLVPVYALAGTLLCWRDRRVLARDSGHIPPAR